MFLVLVNICRNGSYLTVSVTIYICFAILQMTIYRAYFLDLRLLFNPLVSSNLSYGLLQAKVALFIGYCLIDQWMTCCNTTYMNDIFKRVALWDLNNRYLALFYHDRLWKYRLIHTQHLPTNACSKWPLHIFLFFKGVLLFFSQEYES